MIKQINKVIPVKLQEGNNLEEIQGRKLKRVDLMSNSRSDFSKKFNKSSSDEIELYSMRKGKSQNKSYNAIMFEYDYTKQEFDQKNFKEEILGHEIRKEEVKEILTDINNRFVIRDLDCLHHLKKDLVYSLIANILLTPILYTLRILKRKELKFLPFGIVFQI